MAYTYVPYDGSVVTRADAKAAGLKRFFTGVPCRKGHISERYASIGNCSACLSSWMCSEKGSAYHAKYQGTHRAEAVVRVREWRINEPTKAADLRAKEREPNKLRMREKYRSNPELARAMKRVLYAANPVKYNKKVAEWKARNPIAASAIKRNYWARKKRASGSHTSGDIKLLLTLQKSKCAHTWCRVSIKNGYHVDHVMPLAKGGSNDRRNLQLLCAHCNHSKNAVHPIDFAQRNGLLL